MDGEMQLRTGVCVCVFGRLCVCLCLFVVLCVLCVFGGQGGNQVMYVSSDLVTWTVKGNYGQVCVFVCCVFVVFDYDCLLFAVRLLVFMCVVVLRCVSVCV